MEPFWKFLGKALEERVAGNPHPPKVGRGKELLEKYKAKGLPYEEMKELRSIAERCFEKAKKRGDHPKMTYLTLLIGALSAQIEDIERKFQQLDVLE